MNADYFLDTNVLVYAAAGRTSEEAKRRRAVELISNENWGLSTQVLQEFYVSVVRKIATPMSPAKAMEWIEQFRAFPCIAIDAGLVDIAVATSVRHRISYWDAAIIAAAEALGAKTVYSEGLNHGQQVGMVRVCNPFL